MIDTVLVRWNLRGWRLESYPEYFYPALAKLDGLNKNSIAELVNRVNDEWMSHSAKKFAITLMHHTLEQLRELNR